MSIDRTCFVVSGAPTGARNSDALGNDRAVRQVDSSAVGLPSSAAAIRFEMPGRRRFGRRSGPATNGLVPIAPLLLDEIKFFGRYKGGAIRDGVVAAAGGHRSCVGRDWLVM